MEWLVKWQCHGWRHSAGDVERKDVWAPTLWPHGMGGERVPVR